MFKYVKSIVWISTLSTLKDMERYVHGTLPQTEGVGTSSSVKKIWTNADPVINDHQ
jgi:hypothetical protein